MAVRTSPFTASQQSLYKALDLSYLTMKSLGFNLKLSAIFVIFFVSILGAVGPLLLAKRHSLNDLLTSSFYMAIKSVASGVVLGVSLLHLLPDSIEVLETQTDYPRE